VCPHAHTPSHVERGQRRGRVQRTRQQRRALLAEAVAGQVEVREGGVALQGRAQLAHAVGVQAGVAFLFDAARESRRLVVGWMGGRDCVTGG